MKRFIVILIFSSLILYCFSTCKSKNKRTPQKSQKSEPVGKKSDSKEKKGPGNSNRDRKKKGNLKKSRIGKKGGNTGLDDKSSADGKIINRVKYVVGNIPITHLDIEEMKTRMKYLNRRKPKRDRKKPIDELITRAIVYLEARKESLMVTDLRIENEIQKRKDASGISDEREFREMLEKQSGMPYRIWLDEMPYQILKRQLMQLKVSVTPPTEAEMKSFYRKNRKKVGMEAAWREMVFRPRNRADERRISRVANKVYRQVRRNPRKFVKIARTHPENRSRRRRYGGYYGYTPFHKIFRRSQQLAGALFQLRKGQVSPVFVDSRKRYNIVMLVGRRATPYKKIRYVILQRIAMKKVEDGFLKWIEKKRKEIVIIEIE